MTSNRFKILLDLRDKQLIEKTKLYDNATEILEQYVEIKKVIKIIEKMKQISGPFTYACT